MVVDDLRLAGDSFGIRILTVRAHVHVAVIFLFERRPSFLTDEAIRLFALVALLEKCLRCWRL